MRRLLALALVACAARAGDPREAFRFLAEDAHGKLAADLAKARAAALAILFDDKRYPVPRKAHKGWRVGVDRQPGHRDMEDAVSLAIRLHNRWMRVVADGLSVPLRTVGRKRPTTEPLEVTRPVNFYGISVIDLGAEKFLKRYRKDYEAARKGLDRGAALAHAIGALANGDWQTARILAGSLEGGRGACWETLRAAAVLSWNERKGAGHDRNEKDGMRVLNAYRVSLGLAPLILDKRLHAMARDFALEMKRGRFFSHHHPYDPSRRTPGRRARRAGYKGAVGENASTERDAAKAVWFWRGDAGHHRVLVQPFFRAAGMGCAQHSVLNPGNTTERKILALYGAGDRRKQKPIR